MVFADFSASEDPRGFALMGPCILRYPLKCIVLPWRDNLLYGAYFERLTLLNHNHITTRYHEQ